MKNLSWTLFLVCFLLVEFSVESKELCQSLDLDQKTFENKKIPSAINTLFRAVPDSHSGADYQLNFDIALKRIRALPSRFGSNQVRISEPFEYDGSPILRVDLPSISQNPKGTVMMWAGVHGNESVGTAALIEFIESSVYDIELRRDYNFIFFPAINPGGLKKNMRKTMNGVDLNRQFENKNQKFAQLLKRNLSGEKIILGLDIHEGKTKTGFFLIRNQENDDRYLEDVLSALDPDLLLQSPDNFYPYSVPNSNNPNLISYTLLRPGVTTSIELGRGKSFMKNVLGAPYSYTIESGGRINLQKRMSTIKTLIRSFLSELRV